MIHARELETQRPTVTVASIVERDGRFLLVEEESAQRPSGFNQPAGHLEIGESLPRRRGPRDIEETGWHVRVSGAASSIYRWKRPDSRATFIRFAFAADAKKHDDTLPLDVGIVRAVWMTYDELAACKGRA